MPEQTIEIDCAPDAPRPDALIVGVIKDTALPLRDPVAKFFGCWTWDYSDIPRETWLYWNDVIAQRLRALYRGGACRYCSW